MKILRTIIIALVVLIAAAAVFLVVGVPSSFLVDKIQTEFAKQTGRQLEIAGGAKLRFWPEPTLEVRDITLVNTDPKQTDVKIDSARAEIEMASLFSGAPKVTQFTLVHPVLRMPLIRRATPENKPAASKPGETKREIPDIGRVVVKNATIMFMRSKDDVENQVDHINVTATLSQPDHHLDAKGTADAGTQKIVFQVKSKAAVDKIEQSLPVEMTLELPDFLEGTLSSTANVISSGSTIKFNDVEGTVGKDRFTGWASVDMANKPKVKLDLDFKRLKFVSKPAATPSTTAAPSASGGAVESAKSVQPWSDQKIDLDDLNFVDMQAAFSASELDISTLQLAPIYIEGALVNGVLNLALSNTGLYGGKSDGLLTLDVSHAQPRQTLQLNLTGVRALPALSTLANFREIDGTMQGRMDLQATGASERAVMSSLGGTIDIFFKDGRLLDVDLAHMVHTLTQSTLKGWQKDKAAKTDIDVLNAHFKVNSGRATTDDLNLVGPSVTVTGKGTADLPTKNLNFTLEPKLVLNFENKSGSAKPVSFGVPVIVQGNWDSPQIYPDMSGILDNPGAAYSKLHDLGVGLFGKSSTGNDFFKSLGNFLDKKDDNSKDKEAPAAGDEKTAPQDKGKAQDTVKETPSESSKPGESSKEAPKETSKETSKNTSKDDTADDDKFDEKKTRAKIESILKDIFGK